LESNGIRDFGCAGMGVSRIGIVIPDWWEVVANSHQKWPKNGGTAPYPMEGRRMIEPFRRIARVVIKWPMVTREYALASLMPFYTINSVRHV
jgi:hypothetical protein